MALGTGNRSRLVHPAMGPVLLTGRAETGIGIGIEIGIGIGVRVGTESRAGGFPLPWMTACGPVTSPACDRGASSCLCPSFTHCSRAACGADGSCAHVGDISAASCHPKCAAGCHRDCAALRPALLSACCSLPWVSVQSNHGTHCPPVPLWEQVGTTLGLPSGLRSVFCSSSSRVHCGTACALFMVGPCSSQSQDY